MGAPGIEVFDREAARYDAWFDSERGRVIFASEVACLRRLCPDLRRPWLEVGVGTGRFAKALGVDIGVDPSRGALDHARARGVRVLTARGEDLPFGDGEFGAVFVVVTICFADDPEGLLREAARVAGEDGAVILGIVPAGSPWGRAYAAKAREGHAFYSHARFFTLDELEDLADGAGLVFERSVSTLFRGPGDTPRETEQPREGGHEDAGFVAVLCRRGANGDNRAAARRPAEEADDDEGAPPICMKDDVEIHEENPRCPYPSSQCRFRELCRVREAQRAKERDQRV